MSPDALAPFWASFSWHDLLEATQGRVLQAPRVDKHVVFSPSTDTRTLTKGSVYVPLMGERFDGHDFIERAIQSGAKVVLVQHDRIDRLPNPLPESIGVIHVPNTTQAYLALGRYHRRRCSAVVVGLTGSSGKTTTKEMLFQALSPYLHTQCTPKNFNNEIGVAQTLLALHPDTEVLIIEMGMRGLNEITLLSESAEPNLSVVVNVGPAHIGRLGSLENIAQAKSEVVVGLNNPTAQQKTRFPCLTPCCVFDGDSPHLAEALAQRHQNTPNAKFESIPVYLSDVTDLMVCDGHTRFTLDGVGFDLSQPGVHLAKNTQLIVEVAHTLGLTTRQVADALQAPLPSEGRWTVYQYHLQVKGQSVPLRVIHDAYNANPQSVMASLNTLAQELERQADVYPVMILGGMKELGEQSTEYHCQVGDMFTTLQPLHRGELLLVGEEFTPCLDVCQAVMEHPVTCWSNPDAPTEVAWDAWFRDALERWEQMLSQPPLSVGGMLSKVVVWLKGSRTYQLERVLGALERHPAIRLCSE